MASTSFRVSRSDLSKDSDMLDPSNGKPPLPLPPPQNRMTFIRRTSSGRYVSYSRDDLDSELGSSDFLNYTVQMPPTPTTSLTTTSTTPSPQKSRNNTSPTPSSPVVSIASPGPTSWTKVIDSDAASHPKWQGPSAHPAPSTTAMKHS